MTAQARPRLNADLVGKDLGTTTHEVTAEAIATYARATNDPNPRYLAGSDAVAGPVWPVVPAFGSFMDAARDPELGADLRRLLHASEEHVLAEPIRPGDVVAVHSLLESIEARGAGEAFTIVSTETNQHGVVVATVRATMYIRGAGRAAPQPTEHDGGPAVHEDSTLVEADQMQRYAHASGDHNPIHLDRRAARRAGLRAPILHGMCTMAMATKGAVNGPAGGDPTRITRVAVTFARPVLPGQVVTTRFRYLGDAAGVSTYGFETVNPDGEKVITDAVVEVRANS
ncbi:MAG: MaoC family dehydratase N-terminal domain-containing protein [Actinomycetota bacterium]